MTPNAQQLDAYKLTWMPLNTLIQQPIGEGDARYIKRVSLLCSAT